MIFENPEFEWDSNKSEQNRIARGFGFDFATAMFKDEVLIREDNRRDYGEVRYLAIGPLENLFLTVVYTWRSDRVRIISARNAHRSERDAYRKAYPTRDS